LSSKRQAVTFDMPKDIMVTVRPSNKEQSSVGDGDGDDASQLDSEATSEDVDDSSIDIDHADVDANANADVDVDAASGPSIRSSKAAKAPNPEFFNPRVKSIISSSNINNAGDGISRSSDSNSGDAVGACSNDRSSNININDDLKNNALLLNQAMLQLQQKANNNPSIRMQSAFLSAPSQAGVTVPNLQIQQSQAVAATALPHTTPGQTVNIQNMVPPSGIFSANNNTHNALSGLTGHGQTNLQLLQDIVSGKSSLAKAKVGKTVAGNTHTQTSGINKLLYPQSNEQKPNVKVTELELGNKKGFSGDSYRDFSRITCAEDIDVVEGQPPPPANNGKEPPFPAKLHRILSNPEYSDFISWLPHGRSWRVLKPKAFEEKIIPQYFRHAKYASFMRQVNGWGFKRMTQGPDHNSYYHEVSN